MGMAGKGVSLMENAWECRVPCLFYADLVLCGKYEESLGSLVRKRRGLKVNVDQKLGVSGRWEKFQMGHFVV